MQTTTDIFRNVTSDYIDSVESLKNTRDALVSEQVKSGVLNQGQVLELNRINFHRAIFILEITKNLADSHVSITEDVFSRLRHMSDDWARTPDLEQIKQKYEAIDDLLLNDMISESQADELERLRLTKAAAVIGEIQEIAQKGTPLSREQFASIKNNAKQPMQVQEDMNLILVG